MSIKIALAGNPNSGKTTLFNALTGSNQFVGNWPGVTVEKKEGKLKGHNDVIVTDLPGIYSLSPYTLEEVIARNYLINECPDVILNIVDGTNLERNLFLTTQLLELGIPVVVAINMMDIVQKSGDKIDTKKLSHLLGCPVVEISASKGTGIIEATKTAISEAKSRNTPSPALKFPEKIENALQIIENTLGGRVPENQKRFFAVKLFERDSKISTLISNPPDVEHIISKTESEFDEDSESIITNERYAYITSFIKDCYITKAKFKTTTSDKIDKVLTNRWLALPIFAVIMFIVYFVSVTTVGTIATDWANNGVFGDGWYLLGIGSSGFKEADLHYQAEQAKIDAFLEAAASHGIDTEVITETLQTEKPDEAAIKKFMNRAETAGVTARLETDDETLLITAKDFGNALKTSRPDPSDYGIWVPGVPAIVEGLLKKIGTAEWLNGLILDGIVAGVGAVLGFVPQMLVLFLFLAFLEACGYMARVAFIMDRVFRKFGLSGRSFIPLLVGSGCGVPGIMASRTIENDRDRKITIITTTFIPCGAKLPIIALIAGAMFGGAWWVAPSAYFVGISAIVISGIILKKTRLFTGDVSPFVMELPAYRLPALSNVLRSMWERGWSFIKKAGTVILLCSILVWFASNFGIVDGHFTMVDDLSHGFLAKLGGILAPIFAPLGWGNWQASVATIAGLIAKENVVGTFGVLYGFAEVAEDGTEIWNALSSSFTAISAYSFLVFNLLCAPCFAAMGAIRREMNNAKWFWFAIGYQTLFAYAVSMCIYQFGSLFAGNGFGLGTLAAFIVAAVVLYMLIRPTCRNKNQNAYSVCIDIK